MASDAVTKTGREAFASRPAHFRQALPSRASVPSAALPALRPSELTGTKRAGIPAARSFPYSSALAHAIAMRASLEASTAAATSATGRFRPRATSATVDEDGTCVPRIIA